MVCSSAVPAAIEFSPSCALHSSKMVASEWIGLPFDSMGMKVHDFTADTAAGPSASKGPLSASTLEGLPFESMCRRTGTYARSFEQAEAFGLTYWRTIGIVSGMTCGVFDH